MIIEIAEPDGPYKAVLDTEVMCVEIREAYSGPMIKSDDGEELAVFLRDHGFELNYRPSPDVEWQHWTFQNGRVHRLSKGAPDLQPNKP